MSSMDNFLVDDNDVNLYDENIKHKQLVSKKRKHEVKRRYNMRKIAEAGINREFYFETSGYGIEKEITGSHAKMTQLSSRRSYLKRQANRRLRRINKIYNGGQYKKVYDLPWELY